MTKPNVDSRSNGAPLDDWDNHWSTFGAAADNKPASLYRQRLMLDLLGTPGNDACILDIGSGQGEFTLRLKQTFHASRIFGVEYSHEGVVRANQAAAAAQLDVRFIERNLLEHVDPEVGQPLATHAVCSEVLEHVDEPGRLMRNASALLAPGCRVVVTVPGGPRSAFDRHIGHRRHFTATTLSAALSDAGLVVDRIFRAGVPFFNLYKSAAILRGQRLVRDTENRMPDAESSRAEDLLLRFFDRAFRFNLRDSPFGWQLVAIAHMPASGAHA